MTLDNLTKEELIFLLKRLIDSQNTIVYNIEEKELFRCPCPVRRKAEKKFDQKIRFPSAETPRFLLSE